MNKLSASRIKVAQTCSWLYWTKYVLKLPDRSNDGAKRGTICHLVFECLGNPRHKKHYKKILKNKNTFASAAVQKLIEKNATQLSVCDDENIESIKIMVLAGLNYDFYGLELGRPTKSISEKEFDIKVSQDGKHYAIRGFMDKLFLYKRKKIAIIRDFKTSKQVFKGKDLTNNLQHLMYCLAVKHLYPDYLKRELEFLFLKFDLSEDLFGNKGRGNVKMENIDGEELEGFEYELTEIQKYLDNFGELDAKSSYAANKDYPKDGTFGGPLACGKEGYKMSRGKLVLDKDGGKIENYICGMRKPFDYWALIDDASGKVLKTAFLDEKRAISEFINRYGVKNYKIEKLNYTGCPRWEK